MIGLGDVPVFIQHLEAAFGVPDRVSTAEWTIWKITQLNHKFSQCYAEFQVITADLDWNTVVFKIPLEMASSEKMKDSLEHSAMPAALAAFVVMCDVRDNQWQKHQTAKAAHKMRGGIDFTTPPKLVVPPNDPEVAPPSTLAGCTVAGPMDLRAGEEESLRETWRRRLWMGDVCTLVGLPREWWNVLQAWRPRCSRCLQQRLRK